MFSDPLGLYGSEKKAERKRKKAEKAGWVTSPTHNTNGEWTFQVSDPVDFNNTRLVWDENKFDMSPYAQQHGAISEFKPDFYDKWGASKNFFGKLSYSIFDDASVFFSAVSPFREAQHLDGQSANANEATRAMAGLGTQFLFPAKGATGVLGIADDVLKNGDDIALGLRSSVFSFSKSFGFKSYKEFAGTGFNKDAIEAAIQNPNNRIHFILDDFRLRNYWKFDPAAPVVHGNITNWEIYTIMNNPSILSRTTFYRTIDGVVTPTSLPNLSK